MNIMKARRRVQPGKKVTPKPEITYTRKPADLSLEAWQIALRQQFASIKPFRIENLGDHPVYSDFRVTNPENGNSYVDPSETDADGMRQYLYFRPGNPS